MSGNEKAGSGRGNNRKRPFKRWGNASFRSDETNKNDNSSRSENTNNRAPAQDKRFQGHGRADDNQNRQTQGDAYKKGVEKTAYPDRPKWIPPKINTDPLPAPDCPFCGKAIRDISVAIADKDTGVPVHFDCVASRIARGENLENGDVITYIGGGRFGIVNFDDRTSNRDSHEKALNSEFKIKKIIEWEDKEKRAEWRNSICERYPLT